MSILSVRLLVTCDSTEEPRRIDMAFLFLSLRSFQGKAWGRFNIMGENRGVSRGLTMRESGFSMAKSTPAMMGKDANIRAANTDVTSTLSAAVKSRPLV